ncbi:MAG: hypothetical protein SGPRY_012477, partial [Prymnesium sp.]
MSSHDREEIYCFLEQLLQCIQNEGASKFRYLSADSLYFEEKGRLVANFPSILICDLST